MGAVIYYIFSSDAIFVKQIDTLFGKGIHADSMVHNNILNRFIRNYLLDMMWGYALVFALHFILGNNTANLVKIFLLAFSFSALMEFLQITPIANGTFDLFDIFVEFLAEAFAVFIIKNIYEEVSKV